MALGHWLKDYIGPHSGGSGGSGGGGGTEPLIVSTIAEEGYTRLDKTWQEIYDAPIAYLHLESYGLAELPTRLSLISIGQGRLKETGDIIYTIRFGDDSMLFYADSAGGYPHQEEG